MASDLDTVRVLRALFNDMPRAPQGLSHEATMDWIRRSMTDFPGGDLAYTLEHIVVAAGVHAFPATVVATPPTLRLSRDRDVCVLVLSEELGELQGLEVGFLQLGVTVVRVLIVVASAYVPATATQMIE